MYIAPDMPLKCVKSRPASAALSVNHGCAPRAGAGVTEEPFVDGFGSVRSGPQAAATAIVTSAVAVLRLFRRVRVTTCAQYSRSEKCRRRKRDSTLFDDDRRVSTLGGNHPSAVDVGDLYLVLRDHPAADSRIGDDHDDVGTGNDITR